MTLMPFQIRHIVINMLVGGFLLSGAVYSADQHISWPQFHGPNRDNLSTEKGLLKEWPVDGPELIWAAKSLGHGYSSLAIANGMIYTAGNVGEDNVIFALDMDGNILWQVKNGEGWMGDRPGSRGTPTIDSDRVYHESPMGDLICLDAKTGEKIWGFNILEKFDSENIRWDFPNHSSSMATA